MGVQPLAVGLLVGIPALDGLIVHQLLLHRVHQQHLAGTEPGLFHNPGRVNVQHAHLGGENQIAVVRNVPPAGPQAVAVQHRAHGVAVGEDDGGGAVPGLHHGGVVVVEVPLLPVDLLVVGPGLRNAHHHRLGQGDAVHHQEFQGVVQHGGVGAALIHHRENFVHVVLQNGRGHGLLPGQHPVHVAPDGVDLTVVENVAVGMGPLPAGGGVGGEAGVDQRDGALAVRVRQVGVELPQLPYQEHTLVDNGAAGKGGDVGVDVGLLELPPGHIQLPVEFQTPGALRRTLHKALADGGHALYRPPAQHLRVGGHVPPAQKFHAALGHDDLQHLFGLGALEAVVGEKEHAHAVVPFPAQGDSFLRRGLHHQLVGNLNHQAHAVSGFAGGVLAGAVLQLFHDFQGVIHRLIGFDSADADHGADTAGVVLKFQTVRPDPSFFSHWAISPSRK